MKKEYKILIAITAIVIVTILYIIFRKPVNKTAYEIYNIVTTPFKYFTFSEFDSPDVPGSGAKYMNVDFIKMLDTARGKAGVPFKINSGYRTAGHNLEVGGVPNSAHTLGLAADISTPNEELKKKIALALYQTGFKRLGFAKTFIHVDNDMTKPQFAFNYDGQHIYTLTELLA